MQPSSLPPFPNGWYVAAFSHELKPGQIISKQLLGRDVVLYRTQAGESALIDAYCPHMGAHFGHGGQIIEETIWCPFHGFRFDTEGKCTHTGYGTPPSPKCRTGVWPSVEMHGLIIVWFDTQGRPPRWQIPALEMQGWGPLATHQWTLNSHPQETSENSVDIGHLSIVHKYERVDTLQPLHTDGPILHARYTMSRRADFLLASKKLVRTEFDATLYGLGYSFVEARVAEYGLLTRQFVLATPTQAGKMELRIGMALKFEKGASGVHPLLGIFPEKAAMRLLTSKAIKAYAHDVQQDFDVWQHKTYIQLPALAKGDGPVIPYRKWCRQFYTEFEAELAHPEHA